MDKDELNEMVVMSEEDYNRMEEDMEQAARFIDYLMQTLEDCGEDALSIEMEFLKSEDPVEGDIH